MEERRGLQRWHVSVLLVLLLVASTLTVGVAVAGAEESIEVECYLKVDDDYVSMSNVDVYDASAGARTCNSVYMDCKGQCIGCYIDENGDESCYDTGGKKFQK